MWMYAANRRIITDIMAEASEGALVGTSHVEIDGTAPATMVERRSGEVCEPDYFVTLA